MKSFIWQVHRSMSSTTLHVHMLTSIRVNSSHRITLCNPKTRNSLSVTMLQHLINEIKNAGKNQSLKSIVINGNGPIFSAGHNLKELIDMKIQQKVFSLATELMNAMLDCPIPIITAIDGLAAASGCQLVAASDIAICTNRSSFSTPGVNLGLFCSTPGIPLSRCIPKKVASYMLFTGESINAEEALRNGLVSKVVHPKELDDEIDKLTLLIDQKSREVITHGKTFFNQQIDVDIKTAYKNGEKAMLENLQLDDCKEGLQSFIEKRKPNWSN
ncbi:enoyl-CoA hydratase domain-containing protein 3, mitochondrial [Adelges cooleyi]|uniref:enoyl-CoA hydratase domain-containing protein 3, mitochondrial n=1 Tax=Adelges cooleyi TaxID=133065 RepID=UPI0021809AB7|nr:enoyl-CoA hydratase domain-containing protein 3, mitochondrial [Adelges cooleyi]XP_050423510.1 enoyl-CoA hydratase domain-containing protein 3, mitochondrial [Adelges cooleyi]XP_050423511.1 enoyl-CoA hydratase domain-containing protein 3, mitochondrial [Adelges cooleyi]XP_050423512.1 enoyl-CoA hydratase domain-containing protein 3, mitochondrial [Adelges cooleyi]XP_050423513.1 enoyl-CoA hydratase domain-containing protein 3, mitochondrial [Adelges cooleyi]XP_050423514.1 enoyl-CoA hydratase 